MKRITLFIVLIAVFIGMAVPVFAAQGDTLQPLYHSISSLQVGIDIDESTGIAYAGGSVNAYYQVPVEICTQLQVYKNGQWKTLMSWSNSGTGIAYAGGEWPVESGYNYRTRVTGSVCNDLGIPIESEVGTREVYYPAS